MKKQYLITSIFILIVFTVYFLSIGFSTMSTTARIDNAMASVKPTALARITNVLALSNTNNGISNSEEYNMSNINSNIILPYENSTVTYRVSATVYLESYMRISEINILNSNLEYELSGYTIGDSLCDSNNKCNFGATDEFDITIKYKEGAYDSTNTSFSVNISFTFDSLSSVAKIGNNYYSTLQDAIDAVPANNTKTTVVLLRNDSELITIEQGKSVELDLQSFTLSNSGSINVIINSGTLYIKNGIISCNATYGAIDNMSTGSIYMSGGSIIATSTKQAIYNNGGYVEISNSAYLSSKSGERATVHNLANGTVLITGGTIVSEKRNAIENVANLTIGVKDGNVLVNTPVIQGATYGIISTTNYKLHDGIVKGVTAPFSDISKITDMETDYDLLNSTEEINLKVYKTAHLAQIYEVRFNANGGNVDEPLRNVERGKAVGVLPIATQTEYVFDGWFTELDGGTKINKDQIITGDVEYFAHWTSIYDVKLAQIGDTKYSTIQEALDAVPKNNQETVVTVLGDAKEVLTVLKDQNVVLDIGDNVLNNNGVNNVIKNNGTLKINNGTIISNTTQGAINNNKNATLIMTGGSIYTSGTRQAIYNDGGNLQISGTAYLSSTTTQRATVQNLNNGSILITGGTIVSPNFNAIENTAKLTIGIKDGNINSTSPVIIGKNYGINTTSTFKFYDGIIKGIQKTINGTVNEIEDNSTQIDSTETIDGYLYKTTYLE